MYVAKSVKFIYRWEESSSAFHCYVPSRFRAEYLNQALANREHQQGNWNTIINNHRHQHWIINARSKMLSCLSCLFFFNKNSVFQVRMDYSYFSAYWKLKYSYHSLIKDKIVSVLHLTTLYCILQICNMKKYFLNHGNILNILKFRKFQSQRSHKVYSSERKCN